MSLLDGQTLYSDAQAFTVTAVSTNVIDHGFNNPALGIGEPIILVISLDVVADDGDGDETYSVDLQTDDNVGFASAVSLGAITIPRGDPAGTKYFLFLKPDQLSERFTRLNVTLAGTTPSVTFTARLVPANFVQAEVEQPSGFVVS